MFVRSFRVATAMLAVTFAGAAFSQINLNGFLKGAINSASKSPGRVNVPPPSAPSDQTQELKQAQHIPGGFIPSAPTTEPTQPVPWQNKAAFLVATRNGEFIGIPNIQAREVNKEFEPVIRSIAEILVV